jgi:hypothetical protein
LTYQSRNDGLCVQKTENTDRAASTISNFVALLVHRASGSRFNAARINWIRLDWVGAGEKMVQALMGIDPGE